MKKFIFFSLGLSFLFLQLFFSPVVYAASSESSALGYKIPAFPPVIKNYDYVIIRFLSSKNSYELLCMTPNTSERPYICYDRFSSGSITYPFSIVYPNCSATSYQWTPLESNVWIHNWTNPSFNVHQNYSSEELIRSALIHFNTNIYDENGKIFFIATPLMSFTNMQRLGTVLLSKIYPQLIRIMIPSLVALLGGLVVSLKVLPKLFKVFLNT